MKIAILDDYLRLSQEVADWSKLKAACDITVFDRPLGGLEAAARTLEPFNIVALVR